VRSESDRRQRDDEGADVFVAAADIRGRPGRFLPVGRCSTRWVTDELWDSYYRIAFDDGWEVLVRCTSPTSDELS